MVDQPLPQYIFQLSSRTIQSNNNLKPCLITRLTSHGPELAVVRCDVSEYSDIHNLFDTAYRRHGRIDRAISCAGIFELGNWFDPALTIESVKTDTGNLKVLEVNVIGSLYFPGLQQSPCEKVVRKTKIRL